MRKALIDVNNLVVNTVVVEDGAVWSPPQGLTAIDGLDGEVGDTWNGSAFVTPSPDIMGILNYHKENRYNQADIEFIRRGLLIGSWSVRGGSPKDRFTAVSTKEVSKGGPHKVALENHHDNLDALKDLIEAAADLTALEAIDVTDESHWS